MTKNRLTVSVMSESMMCQMFLIMSDALLDVKKRSAEENITRIRTIQDLAEKFYFNKIINDKEMNVIAYCVNYYIASIQERLTLQKG